MSDASCGGPPAAPNPPVAAPTLPGTRQTALRIEQMDCPTEEQLIRDKLGHMPGIAALEFNLMQRTLHLTHTPEALSPAIAAIRSLGMDARQENSQSPSTAESSPAKTRWWPLVISGVAAVAAETVHWFDGGNHTVEIALSLVAILVSGLPTYKKGWIALKNLNLNINALMAIAVTGAMLIGEWPEAAMVMVLFSLAELIEALSLDRARNAIRGLMAMTPEKATVRQADGTWLEQEAARIEVGAVVRVKPGERIPLDGMLTDGQSAVNQAPITGESIPVPKGIGDTVFAGTINETGSFEYRVTAAQTNSTLSRIIKAVEEAQGSRAPTQRFVDQFAKIYTPIVFLFALTVAVAPPLALGLPWMVWIYKALVLLVIACPCALVISTPVTIVSGLASAAKAGILIKGGVYLEEGRKLKGTSINPVLRTA